MKPVFQKDFHKMMLILCSLILTCSIAGAADPRPDIPEAEDKSTPATDQLKKEHRIISIVVRETEKEAAAIRRSGTVDLERLKKIRDFYANFAERCHFVKERRYYFPAVRIYDTAGIIETVSALKNEHDHGHAILQELNYYIDRSDFSDDSVAFIADRHSALAELTETNRGKEDTLLFPKSDAILPAAEQKAIYEGFKYLEQEQLGQGFHQKYLKLAKELAGEKTR